MIPRRSRDLLVDEIEETTPHGTSPFASPTSQISW